jgi:molecular chaperone Hsp33
MADNENSDINGAIVTVDFVRHRNALLVRADFGPLFTDYYLHLSQHGLRHTEMQDKLFKDLLAAFTLHCASRPQGEHVAWTLNVQEPRLNLFFAGDNEDFDVAGRIFTDNVREAARNLFYSDVIPRRGAERRRSVVEFDGAEAGPAIDAYYTGSEQRLVRFFPLEGDEYAMLVSHPDCDEAWFKGVQAGEIRTLAEKETLARIERRAYRWNCGCTQRKIIAALAPAFRADAAGLFGEGESIRVQCPRCAATHVLTREAMEAFVAETPKAGA